jgi:hypothetical protein
LSGSAAIKKDNPLIPFERGNLKAEDCKNPPRQLSSHMQPIDIISDLIARFERNLEEYKAGRYNEAQVRREAAALSKSPLAKGDLGGCPAGAAPEKHNPLTPFFKG